ncbi:alpha-glucosidase family protein [Colwellia sp. MEBiC06753]
MQQQPWWRGAVIYQIYPRSFMDANNDGIGDLQGIIEKLPYIQSLGVDAIWISPFFKSPMKDFGYDISDYRDIDPMFGTMADFDELMAKAKSMDIKVIIDQVLSHTSDQHPWFTESRTSRDNDKADWYVWADANEDGTPPNNWLSIFGGVAWQWEPRRQQYYLHNFLTEQPDLNFHNPQVRKHVLDNVEYWLKKGVDGFRLDAINFCYHDAQLRDNPAKPASERKGRGFSEDNPYAFQYHYFNNTQPENVAFMEDIRALINKYPGAVTLGEISSEDSLLTMSQYTKGDKRLHMAYSFELLTQDCSPKYIRQTIEELEANLSDGWPCWAIGNHDVQRVATRWSQDEKAEANVAQVNMYNAMLASLRGSICTYQGEELGLVEGEIAFEQLQDPYGITFWPNFKGRDGCRTPIAWNNSDEQGGFSQSEDTWLPVVDSHKAHSVAVQETDQASALIHYRRFMKWRKTMPTLMYGDIEFLDAGEQVLAVVRTFDGQSTLAVFNFSSEVQVFKASDNLSLALLEGHGFSQSTIEGSTITLAPFGAAFTDCQLVG